MSPRKIAALRRETGAIPPNALGKTTTAVLQYSVGVLFGRWDVRFAIGQCPLSAIQPPFEALPACPPGMLVGENGFPTTVAPQGFPVRIDGDGILPDDPDHSDNIVRRVEMSSN